MRALNDEYNSRVMKSIGASRWDRYLSSEKPLMNPLPPEAYVFKYEKLFITTGTYTRLKNILERGLDSVPLKQGDTSYMPANDDVRGPSAYM